MTCASMRDKVCCKEREMCVSMTGKNDAGKEKSYRKYEKKNELSRK